MMHLCIMLYSHALDASVCKRFYIYRGLGRPKLLQEPKMYSLWHKMFKHVLVSGAPPQTLLGSLRRSVRPPSCKGLLAFGNRSFASSALAIIPTWTIYHPKNSTPHLFRDKSHTVKAYVFVTEVSILKEDLMKMMMMMTTTMMTTTTTTTMMMMMMMMMM